MTVLEQQYLADLAQTVAGEVVRQLKAEGLVWDERPNLNLFKVAERLGISERSVRAMVLANPPVLASMKVGPSEGSRVVEPAELDRYLEERRAAGREAQDA